MTDIDKAKLDPTAVFRSPEDVLRQADLSREQKIDILCRWEYDARELEVAEEEGMPASQPDLLDRILQALHTLGAWHDPDHTAPTKQGGQGVGRHKVRTAGDPGMTRDAEIKHAVLGELVWDTRVEETEVGVEVAKGVVTLTGTVSSYAKKLAAQAAAQRVAKVRDVVNDIQVNLPGRLARTDTDIAQMVRQVLTWDVLVPDERITTLVADGWVTLEGSVDVWAQREEAERAIRHLAGVREVTNRLAVQAPQIAPREVRQAIAEALQRRAAHWADHVEITVHNGTVTLAGQVRSWAEKHATLGTVGHTTGVAAVNDQLRIASAD